MVTLTNGKRTICITLLEMDETKVENMTKQVIPTGMFYMDSDGDYVVEDIDEYIRRALEWLNEDASVIRSVTISKSKGGSNDSADR